MILFFSLLKNKDTAALPDLQIWRGIAMVSFPENASIIYE